ncbi:lipid A export permease/ATP-binding protein MsbA [Aestuariicella hydrocarbonica]|uniref:Lipid A export permease/ATP-binding protein MsbA n=1 Tax=Pseudomaricurvus hydrocarbonicus TaxID=1470433 RepID=A0A9E5JXU5_9GAMM|nr:lipid A export permease/ATP-binding protein MsbA [Aestuariicella hydrocarbonica]NHO66540.1 lipid A export permease/ATP-binding protein MsbA [Aestuariicella hydrocarbonica]
MNKPAAESETALSEPAASQASLSESTTKEGAHALAGAPPAGGVDVYWRLLKYLGPYWHIFALSIIGFLIFAASQPALAQVMEMLINAIESGDRDQRVAIPLLMMAIFAIRGVGSFVGNYFIAKVSLNIVHNLRVQLFNQLTCLPSSYFDEHNSGNLISRITYNVQGVTGAATDALKVLIREGFTVVCLLGYLLWKDWKLTMVFVVIAPFIGILVATVGKRLKKLASKIQVVMGNITQICSEMISGYRVMRTFSGEEYERRRFEKVSQENLKQNLKLVKTSALATPVMQVIVAAAMGALVYLAMTFMDTSSPGAFVAYITAAGLIPKPVRQLSEIYGTIQKGIAAAQSIFEQLDEQTEHDDGTLESGRLQGRIEFKDLSFAYQEEDGEVLKEIDLEIAAGETVALVGSSGSGKSTLASLIPRFYDYQQGQILIDGQPLTEYTLSSLRSQIALVNQDVVLFNDTVASNIAYGGLAGASEEAIRQAADAAHATEFIENMPRGFNTLIGEDGTRLSGGQRQRLAIARALLKDAPILILDEATSALDTESERAIQGALEELMKGRTTLVIAHRLSTIESADKIVVMDRGRIVEIGNHAQLLEKQGTYAKLHSMQFQG